MGPYKDKGLWLVICNTFAAIKRSRLKSFAELGIGKKLITGLKELNIKEPTEVQATVIPLLLDQTTDVVVQAQTGTGKTAAYGLPLLHGIDPNNPAVQAVVLCPTRELGKQVAKQFFRFTKYTEKVFTEAVYGGEQIEKQINALRRPTHIVVATPGRLIDLAKRKALDLKQVRTIVLDEADEMLSMGFKKELNEVLNLVSSAKAKWLFSATIPEEIQLIVERHLSESAHRVEIGGSNVLNEKIEHHYVVCEEYEKLEVLLQFLKAQHGQRGMVFCKTKNGADKLAKQLASRNVPADAIHGDLLQKERDKVMRAFKNETLRILVATDIAARGIDIQDLGFVVHYNVADKLEYYTHRSGRTARAGKEGISMNLVGSSEMRQMRYLEKNLNLSFTKVK